MHLDHLQPEGLHALGRLQALLSIRPVIYQEHGTQPVGLVMLQHAMLFGSI